MSDNKHTGRSFNGKGYYIALILCAAAIGISGYLYYRNANHAEPSLRNDPAATDAVGPGDTDNIQAVATQPGSHPPAATTPPPPLLTSTATTFTYSNSIHDARPICGTPSHTPQGA